MTTWIAAARATSLPARRHGAAHPEPLTPLPCARDIEDTLEPPEHDAMRFCADPTIRLTLACRAAERSSRGWHPWE
jgi:hypothetical protein